MLHQIAIAVVLAAAWSAAIGCAVLLAIGTLAAIELWDDRRRARREDDQ